MKKLISTILVLSIMLSLSACSANNGNGNGSEEQGSKDTEEAVPAPPEIHPTLSYDAEAHRELFDTPTAAFRWNAIIHDVAHRYRTGAESWISTIKYMEKNGYGGVVLNADWDDEYLKDPEVFEQLNAAAKELFDRGLNVWIYDEYGYPSGNAGGQTVIDHPEYVAKGLVYIRTEGSGKNPVTVSKDNDLIRLHSAYAVDASGKVHSASVGTSSVTFGGCEGDWTLYVFAEKKLYEGTHAENSSFEGNGWITRDYLNVMDKNAVGEFINNTYKVYRDSFAGFSDVGGIFTDEPSLMEKYQNTGKTFKYGQIAWVDGFAEEFESMHGYSLLTELHNLFEGSTEHAKTVRVNYRQTVAKLVSENYFGQINEFCTENGTFLSGHCLLEEGLSLHAYYYGDLMQSLRKMGIPGVDCLTGDPEKFIRTTEGHYMAIKYASSVSKLIGETRTMLELAPTDYGNLRLTEGEMNNLWQTLSLQYFFGANQISSYLSLDALSYRQKLFCNYFSRLAYMSRTAKWNGGIAVYYPINTAQAYSTPSRDQSVPEPKTVPQTVMNSICMKISQKQMDYLVVDNEFIREARIENGRLCNDHVSFRAVVMPAVEVMPLDVAEKLIEFTENGGSVMWLNCTPTVADKHSDTSSLRTLMIGVKTVSMNKTLSDLEELCGPKLKVRKSTSTLYIGTYTLDDAPMYWLYNNNGIDKSLTISYKGALAFDIYEAETGKITRVYGDSFEYTLKAYKTSFITVIY